MMRCLFLRLLSVVPFGLVSFAAKAALQDLNDQKAVDAVVRKLQFKRSLVMEEGSTSASIGEAMERFKSQNQTENAEVEFWKLIGEMEKKGLLQRHGEFLMALVPSQY